MRLTQILQPQCVKVPLQAAAKQQAIYELVDLLAAQGLIDSADELKAAAWAREQTRTTGIGHGVAIPHAKCAGAHKLVMAVGKANPPLEFASVDGKPVELIFFLASPLDQAGPHVQALASISRLLTDPGFRAAVKNAATGDDLYRVIAEQESKVAV